MTQVETRASVAPEETEPITVGQLFEQVDAAYKQAMTGLATFLLTREESLIQRQYQLLLLRYFDDSPNPEAFIQTCTRPATEEEIDTCQQFLAILSRANPPD